MTAVERLKRLERLLEVTRNLGAALDLEPFLQSVISVACEMTESETASILELDEGGQTLHFLAVPFFHREILRGMQVPVDGSIAGWTIQNAQPVIIPDTAADKRHFREADRQSGFATRNLLAVPILFRGQPVGVLEAVNKASAHYTEDDLTILETLASLAALSLRNAALEQRIRTFHDEMAELDRLKNNFIAITSHELRTPLGLILGHATFLREQLEGVHHDQLDTIIRNATRLKDIIENLANVDNYETGAARVRQRSVSVARIVEEVVESYQPDAAKKGVVLRANVGKNDLPVEADGGKIAVALGNLVKNAIIFTNKGGHVFVTAEPVPGYVKVSVVDDGIGIPSKDLPRIFERFFQVESHLTRRHGGMGLGLSVAKVMIEMHGGRIWAESVEGKGSNFTFLLPINSEQASAAQRVFLP
ncbi:MAG: ATP-binding protein [Chloroflexota bacterium]